MSVLYGTGRPKDGYLLSDGTRVPSVTEVIGKFKNSGALMSWAHKLGRLGRDPKAEMECAGRWGTAVHNCLESYLGAEMEPCAVGPTAWEAAMAAFDKPSVKAVCKGLTHVEVPMVSEKHRFGGTFDFLAGGVICDWKTSSDIYVDYLIQMGAYKVLCDENGLEAHSASIILIKKKTTDPERPGELPTYEGTGEVLIVNMGPDTLATASKLFLNHLESSRLYETLEEALREGKRAAKPPRATKSAAIKAKTKFSGYRTG